MTRGDHQHLPARKATPAAAPHGTLLAWLRAATPPPVDSRGPGETAPVTVIVSDEEFLVGRALEDLSVRLSTGVVRVEVTHLQAADLTAARHDRPAHS